jgi:hypothetical protein
MSSHSLLALSNAAIVFAGAFLFSTSSVDAQQRGNASTTVTGGSATGGSAVGGSATSGSVSGDASKGGVVTGGSAVGGSATGGSATGASTGGSVTGGSARGGAASATAGRATGGTVTPGSASTQVGDRRITATADGGVSIESDGGHALVKLANSVLVVESDRLILDGKELAKLPSSAKTVSIVLRDGELTVRAGNTEVLTHRLGAR